ncbi:MAG: patatin-like phospholipase family protein [Pseudomonadota bacterium]
MTTQRIGLVLGGGAALGWAHIGVLRTLMAAGVPIHSVTGTSIGAVVAAALAEDKLDHLEELARNVTVGTILRYLDPSFRRGGMLGGRTITAELKRHFGNKRIEELATPFCAVATDLVTGEEIWLREGPVVEAVRASIALPGIFTPVRRGPHILADGGLVNPVPVAAGRALGADKIIAVNLQADYKGRAAAAGLSPEGPLPKRAGVSITRASVGLLLRTLTKLRLDVDAPDVLIAPTIGHVDVADFRRAAELIRLGREAAHGALPEIERLLADPMPKSPS